MMIIRRFLSNNPTVIANKARIIHIFPLDAEKHKLGNVRNPVSAISSYIQYSPLKRPDLIPQDSKDFDKYRHGISKENIKKNLSDILQYAENKLRDKEELSVVHVSTPEFFYYPNTGIFSESDMLEIIGHVKEKSIKMKPGVHFNFGTFPFHITTKPFKKSFFDKLYGNDRFEYNILKTLKSHQIDGDFSFSEEALEKYLKELNEGDIIEIEIFIESSKNHNPKFFSNIAICGNSGKDGELHLYSKMYKAEYDPFHDDFFSLSTNDTRVIKSKTLAESEFLKIYEVCLNHAKGVAEYNEELRKVRLENKKILSIHEVISSSIYSIEDNILSETFSHNDTRNRKQRIIISIGGKLTTVDFDPHVMDSSSHQFRDSTWIASAVFEHEVNLGSLIIKPATATEISLQTDEGIDAPLPEGRGKFIQRLGRNW